MIRELSQPKSSEEVPDNRFFDDDPRGLGFDHREAEGEPIDFGSDD